jgi:hypothetical protein
VVDFDQLKKDMEEKIEKEFYQAAESLGLQETEKRIYLKTVGIVCDILQEYDKRKQEYIAI